RTYPEFLQKWQRLPRNRNFRQQSIGRGIMVKQFDIVIVDLNSTQEDEKGKNRPCVIISNNLVNKNSSLIWALPITSRKPKYVTDISLKTKQQRVGGLIDCVQIRAIDIEARGYKVVDHLQENIQSSILESVEAHIDIKET